MSVLVNIDAVIQIGIEISVELGNYVKLLFQLFDLVFYRLAFVWDQDLEVSEGESWLGVGGGLCL